MQKRYEPLEWPENYYAVTDAKMRKELLEQAIQEEGETFENQVRTKLYDFRYGNQEGKIDNFVRLWVDLSYAAQKMSSVLARKSIIKTLNKDLEDMGFSYIKSLDGKADELFYQELYHFSQFYFELCEKDKTFGSVLVGIVKLEEAKLQEKIAMEVAHAAYEVPKNFGLEEELKIFTKASTDAFRDCYPKSVDVLAKYIQNY